MAVTPQSVSAERLLDTYLGMAAKTYSDATLEVGGLGTLVALI